MGVCSGGAAQHVRWKKEGDELILDHEEKMERRELPAAMANAGRLARGLDQLLESMAQADQTVSLDAYGILALMSISERHIERI